MLRKWLAQSFALVVYSMVSIGMAFAAVGDERTVLDNERGGFFTHDPNGDWSQLGADFGLRTPAYDYDEMNSFAVKGVHGRLQHFEQAPQINYSYFPFQLLREYEADEVAQGREPIWVTATYDAKSRPALFSWHVTGGWGKTQAVNIQDDRFLKFFIKQYCRGVLMDPYRPNWYVGLDNCSFNYDLYGVLDDNEKFISDNIIWDDPFPKSITEWMDAAQYAFSYIKEYAPDIQFVCNEGSQPDESRYPEVFKPVTGVIWEGALGREPWERAGFGTHFLRLTGADKDKIQIFQFNIRNESDPQTRLRTGYCLYSICRGPNSFFGPQDETSTLLAPALYAQYRNDLGRPLGDPQMIQEPGKEKQYQLYWRECQGGIAYLNLTGGEKTITLPPGEWYNREGARVIELALPDFTGDYVLRTPGLHTAWPTINPRYATKVTGPVSITIDTAPWTIGATIRYTLDGTEPGLTSPIYTQPVELNESCVVKARAYKQGMLPSFTASASYMITQEVPRVSFHLSQDSGSEFLNDYPLVVLSHPSVQEVSVNYRLKGGTATSDEDFALVGDVLTFPPGEQCRHFYLPIINDKSAENTETIVLELYDPIKAMLGAMDTYAYSIIDND